jgi:integrase/recombinase XerD
MIDAYIQSLARRGCQNKTIYGVRLFLREFRGHTNKEVHNTREDIESYRAYLGTKKISPRTIRDKMWTVKRYFRYLKDEGHILADPARDIDIGRHAKDLPRNIPSHSTLMSLLDQPDTETLKGKRDKAILELLYSTGIRRAELLNLDMYDIDLKGRELFIREGKGKKDRVVPIGAQAAKWLEIYVSITRKRYLRNRRENALFLTANTGERVKRYTLEDILHDYRTRVKHGGAITSHKIRHACAIGMLRNNADITMIQKLLGHKRLSTTQIYTKLSPEDLKHAYKRYHPREKMKLD